ncbi:MAG: hypothetical protein KGM24_07165 [Elusimicrobia bacterium]|nr:hypothetical protein [Elusimicrobiota bacterium]
MIDLFGLGRSHEEKPPEGAAPPPEEPAPAPEPETPRGASGLWLFLLVLDVLFVAVFGGVVAAKIMQYWKQPAPAAARRPVTHRAPAPKPAPAPAETAAPEPPKPAAEAPKPAKSEQRKPAAHAEAKRTPLPSLTEAPAPHAAPKPSAAPGAAHARPAVFRLRAPHARSVQLVGAFIVHGGRMPMKKGKHGEWSLKLYLNPGQYRYLFLEDGRKILDPENPRSERGASLLNVP